MLRGTSCARRNLQRNCANRILRKMSAANGDGSEIDVPRPGPLFSRSVNQVTNALDLATDAAKPLLQKLTHIEQMYKQDFKEACFVHGEECGGHGQCIGTFKLCDRR